ncbi:MAG: hypothetical protein ABSH20_25305 [Tepidisphaeraceae bacterium]|jgi:hypothetical protein
MRRLLNILAVLSIASAAWAQTTRPATGTQSADDVLNRLLQPSRPVAQPLQPEPDPPKKDAGTVKTVAPAGEQLNLIREGTYLVDRVGRLTKTADNMNELTLEADGQGMKDPPLLILPNLKLMTMEKYIQSTSRDLRFRVTGLVTEYNARNYILLDKVVVVPDQLAPVQRKSDSDQQH